MSKTLNRLRDTGLYIRAVRQGDVVTRTALERQPDPGILAHTLVSLLTSMAENNGYDVEQMVGQLIDHSPDDRQLAEEVMSDALDDVSAQYVLTGEHVWNPITDTLVIDPAAHPDAVAEAEAAIKGCLRDGYSGPSPALWNILELHYRKVWPDEWPVSSDQGHEFYLQGVPDEEYNEPAVLMHVKGPSESESIFMLPVADASLLARQLAYEVEVLAVASRQEREPLAAVQAPAQPALRVVRADDTPDGAA